MEWQVVLRDYQSKLKVDAALALRKIRRLLVWLSTGGGKTVIFSSISASYIEKSHKSVLILVDRKELLMQTRKMLYNGYGITAELIVAGAKYIPPKAPVYLGMVESVNRRLLKLFNAAEIGLVIIDECHTAVFNKMVKVFEQQHILGFTATPVSSSRKDPLKNYYDGIVLGPPIQTLIKDGHLAQNITRAPADTVDRSHLEVDKMRGDFDETAMAREFSRPKYIYNTVEAYKKWSLGNKTLVFNVNKEHNKAVCQAFVEAGLNAKWIDSDLKDHERDAIFRWLKETPDAILCNVGIATKGFDEPTVETIIMNKATLSLANWIQITGRGSRPINAQFIKEHQAEYPYVLSEKSFFTIIDMGKNWLAHGDWCNERDWKDIFENPPKPGDGNGIAPCKQCPKCEGIVPAQTKICPLTILQDDDLVVCGHEFPVKAAPVEQELRDFVVITKNIDVDQIIELHKNKNKYYPFYRIGEDLVKEVLKTTGEMSNERANFILSKYYELLEKWMKAARKKDKELKWRFDEWHRRKAKQHLFTKLKEYYIEWQPQQE